MTHTTPEVEEILERVSQLGVITGYAGEEDIEPIFDFISQVDDDGSRVDFRDWLRNVLTTLTTKHQEELEKAVEEVKSTLSYKDMFKRTSGKPFPVQLMEVERKMVGIVLDYCTVLEQNGYKLSSDGYYFMLSLPILAKTLEKSIRANEGMSCCVDKTYQLLHQEFYKHLTPTTTDKTTEV